MSQTLSRAFMADIEVRSDGTGRTVHGILVPYEQVARVSDGGPAYQEMFARGAFARDISARAGDFSRVKLLFQHDSNNPIGRAVDLRDDPAGVIAAFRVTPEAQRGEEALALVRDGVVDSFSVGFRAITHEKRDGVVVRTKAGLREGSLVTFPAYAGALVSGLRALDPVNASLAQQLLTQLAVADAQIDPFVDMLTSVDGALDLAQAWLSSVLAVPNPDPPDPEDMGMDPDEMGPGMDPAMSGPMATGSMGQMSDSLASFARRLEQAIHARTQTPGSTADGRPEPAATPATDPASATPSGIHPSHRSLRFKAREIGAL